MRCKHDLPTQQTFRTLFAVTALTLFSVPLLAEPLDDSEVAAAKAGRLETVKPAPLEPLPLPPLAPPPPPAPPVAGEPAATPPPPVAHEVAPAAPTVVYVAPAAPAPAAPTSVVTVPVTSPDEGRSHWRIALGGLVAGIGTKDIVANNGAGAGDKQTARGASVSLGYDATRILGFTAFVGGIYADSLDNVRLMAGGDIQLMPFRLPIGSIDVLEFGMLGGANNLLVPDSDRIGWHVGARVNINLANTLGFTTVARVNAGYWMLEGGVTARL